MRTARRSDLGLVLLLLLVAGFARAVTFGNPIVHVDEEFYFTVARAWLDGAVPYVDVWDRKPLGLFLVYLPAAALGFPAGIWAYQALALAFATSTAWVVVRLARAGGWTDAAPLAGIGYLLWLDFAEGQGGQAPVFYNLPVALAGLLLAGDRAAIKRNGLVALALIGVALTIKPTAVFEGVFFGGWTMVRFHASRRSVGATLGYGAALVSVALAPTGLCAAWYAAIGQLDAWTFANISSIFLRRPERLIGTVSNLALLLLFVSGPVALSVVAWREHRAHLTSGRMFLFTWLAAACGGVLVFGTWFDHYGLPLLVPGCACAAGALTRDAARRGTAVALVLAAILGQIVLVAKQRDRGTPAQFAAAVRALDVAPPGCLYVYSGTPMTYAATPHRCHVTRWLFPRHLTRERENGAVGVGQAAEVRRILAARPAVIVVAGPFRGDRPEIKALVTAALARSYARTASLPLGHERAEVFASTSRR